VYCLEVTDPEVLSESHVYHPLMTLINTMETILEDRNASILEIWSEKSPSMLCVFWRHMLGFLMKVLASFQKCPHSAALASTCIRLIIELDCDAETYLLLEYIDFPLLVSSAYLHGTKFNALLEQESFVLQTCLVDIEDLGSQEALQNIDLNAHD
jgi:hypothetical protein